MADDDDGAPKKRVSRPDHHPARGAAAGLDRDVLHPVRPVPARRRRQPDRRVVPGHPSPLDFGDRSASCCSRRSTGSTASRTRSRAGRAVQPRRDVRLGAGVPVHPRHRRLHDRGVRHRRARPRDPPPRLPVSRPGPVLIVILSLLFGLLGSVMAWSDETLGMYALIVPLMIALRYDRMVAVAVVTVAPFVGRIGSTINPFVLGIGSDAAGHHHRRRHRAAADPVRARDGGDDPLHAALRGAGAATTRRVAVGDHAGGRGAGGGRRRGAAADDRDGQGDHRAGRLHLRAADLLDHSLGRDPRELRRSIPTPTRRSTAPSPGSSAGGCPSSARCSS